MNHRRRPVFVATAKVSTLNGDTYRDLGRPGPARLAWQEAIDLYRAKNLEAPAGRVKRRLADPGA